MDYADIYYVDPRNADPRAIVTDPRAQFLSRVPFRPAAATVTPSGGTTITPIHQQPVLPAQPFPYGYPPGWPSQWPTSWPSQWPMPGGMLPGGMLPGGMLSSNSLASIIGGFGGVGSLVDVVAQVLAAVLPLPQAADASKNEDSASAANENSAALLTYQSSLATYAKRDEQIRTIGRLLKTLVG